MAQPGALSQPQPHDGRPCDSPWFSARLLCLFISGSDLNKQEARVSRAGVLLSATNRRQAWDKPVKHVSPHSSIRPGTILQHPISDKLPKRAAQTQACNRGSSPDEEIACP